jgi:PAS domain S-box-containing protein
VRTRRELEESQRRLELALGASSRVGTWNWDVPADRLSADPRFAELYGVDVDEAREGAPLERYTRNIHPDDVPAVAAAIDEALRTGEVFSAEYRLLQADGSERWVVAQGRVAHDADGTPASFPGVVYDITAVKQAQLHAEEQLRQAQKMEAIGQLTGGIAHDFNNLLSGIVGWLAVLQVRVTQGRTQDLDRYVALARNAARRASTLTHRLLAFSRKQALAPRLLAVDRLVNEMEDLIHRSVGPAITLEVRTGDGPSTARVDPNQLESALLNLCINARDAMPGGGRIVLAIESTTVDESEGERLQVSAGRYVVLRVTDTGHGMTPQIAARVFEPFFTTKPLGQGTGLGLSMVYGFARQSGGTVEVESQPGLGTTMRLYLPSHAGEAEVVERTEGRTAPSHAGVGLRALVVDDEPTVRLLVAEILSDYGYSTIEAADADAALPVLQSNTRIDVLVTDVGLRGALNGPELAAAARDVRPDLNVLFVTGYADAHGLDPLPARTRLLLKPFEPDVLALTVHELTSEA